LARQEEEEEEDSSGSKSSDSGESKEERQVTWIEDEGRYEKKEKVKRANKHACVFSHFRYSTSDRDGV
jgi:hypothetical protein